MNYSTLSVDEIAVLFAENFHIKGKQVFGDGISYDTFQEDRKTYFKDESPAQIYVDNENMRQTVMKATKYEQDVYGDKLTEENTKTGFEIYKAAVDKYNSHNRVYKFLGRIFGFTNKERENIKNMEKVFEFNGITKEELKTATSSKETMDAKVNELKSGNKLVDSKFADRKKDLENEVNKVQDIRYEEEQQAEIKSAKERQERLDALSPEQRLKLEREALAILYSHTSYGDDLQTIESNHKYLQDNKKSVEESIKILEDKDIQEYYKQAKKEYDEASKIIETGVFDKETKMSYDNAKRVVQSYEKHQTDVEKYYKVADQTKELLDKNPLTFDEFFEQHKAKENEKIILNAFQNIDDKPSKDDIPKIQNDDFSVSQKAFAEKINSDFTKEVGDELKSNKANPTINEVNKTLDQKK